MNEDDSYIHGPGTLPHSEGCRCEKCAPSLKDEVSPTRLAERIYDMACAVASAWNVGDEIPYDAKNPNWLDRAAHETSPPTAPMLTVFWREVIKVADAAGLKKGMGLEVTLGWDLIEAARRAMRLPEEPFDGPTTCLGLIKEGICSCGLGERHAGKSPEKASECLGCKEGWQRCQGNWHWDSIGHMHECTSQKTSPSLPPCECLLIAKEPSAYHALECPRFVADKL